MISSSNSSDSEDNSAPKDIQYILGISSPIVVENTEYYVKYKNRSYRECEFITLNQLQSSPQSKNLISKLYKQPIPFRQVSFIPGLYKPCTYSFDEGFIRPERVISDKKVNGECLYLVKWYSLDYDDCTWENDVPINLIQYYYKSSQNTNPVKPIKLIEKDPRSFKPIEKSPSYRNNHIITDFQIHGVNWFHENWLNNRNSILADEMGLGKTIQSLCFLTLLKSKYLIKGPFLIVTPLSTISNWLGEIENWTDFRAISFTGTKESRSIVKKYCLFKQNSDKTYDQNNLICDIILTSFETLKVEMSLLKKIHFRCMIVDEAQRLKNPNAITYKLCSEICKDYIILLTGTPVQNNFFEFWSILHFVDEKMFPDFVSFNKMYENTEDPAILEKMKNVSRPYLLRRKKADVNIQISSKEETIIDVELTNIQRTFYKTVLDENREILLQNITKTKSNLTNIVMELRKICDHPYLLPNVENMCIQQYRQAKNILSRPNSPTSNNNNQNNGKNNVENNIEITNQALIYSSGKMILLDKLLPKLHAGSHKILIFSQMTKMLDILEDYLLYKSYQYERLDGSKNYKSRQIAIEHFQKDPNSFVFLLSTRAGGLGLNLTVADTVIIFDSDFNPQNDIQAQARCHRIGQTRDVKVYRLITRATYESEMFFRASKKLALDYALLDSKLGDENTDEHDVKELEMILKKGAYYTFTDECDELDKFCEEDIDQILENRAHVIKHDIVSGGNSVISKIEFNTTGNDALNIDFDSPDFWANLLPPDPTPIFDSTIRRTRRKRHIFYDDNKDATQEDDSYYSDDNDETNDDKNGEKNREKHKKLKKHENEDEDEDFILKKDSQSSSENENDDLRLSELDSDIEIIGNSKGRNPYSKTLLNSSINMAASNFQRNVNPDSSAPIHYFHKTKSPKNRPSVPNSNRVAQPQSSSTHTTTTNPSNTPNSPHSDNINLTSEDRNNDDKINEEEELLKKTESLAKSSLYLIHCYGLLSIRFVNRNEAVNLMEDLIIYMVQRIPDTPKIKFIRHIDSVRPELLSKLFKKPTYPFDDENFANKIFEGKEIMYLSMIVRHDEAYKVAIYISNEVLPSELYFAPSFYTPPYWTSLDDFTFYCATVMLGFSNIKDLFNEPHLPFCRYPIDARPNDKWLSYRFIIITNEILQLIPKDYRIEGKLINDVKFFQFLNWRIFQKTTFSRNLQKQILKAIYLYGIPLPNSKLVLESDTSMNINTANNMNNTVNSELYNDLNNDGNEKPNEGSEKSSVKGVKKYSNEVIMTYIRKLKMVCLATEIDDIVFAEYVSALLAKIQKINSHVDVGVFHTFPPKKYNFKWIPKKYLAGLADNIVLLQKVRSLYDFVAQSNNMMYPKWNIAPSWWDGRYDKKMFMVTACYGFLLFSELARSIMNEENNKIIETWRTVEIKMLSPRIHNNAKHLHFLFNIDERKKRLELLINMIKKKQRIDIE
ncbi:hypothetical protein TRFO_37712 [Tritrichomonas foetus]|uniref:SNF2 family N-terminal domain containing protein n=1 Tax=Tritrichomonas foetus TaxID=1144522 RepID=A0A1J4JAC9_9EUKA|nr:hypothetical protein TRFO_37712 [Tritrichomonas foetus]|eukprot:OHS96130.1 hypothetical protein TRFO_37712 [Tritrichomonas foetus]